MLSSGDTILALRSCAVSVRTATTAVLHGRISVCERIVNVTKTPPAVSNMSTFVLLVYPRSVCPAS
jgi:hypothetical protein